MDINALLDATRVRPDEQIQEEALRKDGVAVARNGHLLNFFWSGRDAEAWLFHTFGYAALPSRKLRLRQQSLKEYTPHPGDIVVYDGHGAANVGTHVTSPNGLDGFERAGVGVLLGSFANVDKVSHFYSIFNYRPSGLWRTERSVDGSGGPLLPVPLSRLRLIGLRTETFCRWDSNGPRANGSGNFMMTVPAWRWDGNNDPTPEKKT